MAQQSLIDAFDDCINRMANGEPLEDCLRRYPAYSSQLRPLVEASAVVRQLRVPEAELLEDQALVWAQIMGELPAVRQRRRRGFPLGLLAAALLLLALMMATWFFLTRPQLPPDEQNIIPPPTNTLIPTLDATATVTLMPGASATVTAAATLTPTVTLTATHTLTVTLTTTPTVTRTPLPTGSPTPTFEPGCGAPLTEQAAINRVLEIYPNTTVVAINQVVKFGGTLVWEIKTSHNLEINISVGCGVILTIDQLGSGDDDGNTNGNVNDNQNGSTSNTNNPTGSTNDNSGGGGSNDNGNDNSDDDGNDNSGSDNSGGGDDNSGSGGDDDDG